MNSSIRKSLVIFTSIAALGTASLGFAGMTGKALEKYKERGGDQTQAAQPAPQRENARPGRGSRQAQAQAQAQAPASRDRGPQGQAQGQRDRGPQGQVVGQRDRGALQAAPQSQRAVQPGGSADRGINWRNNNGGRGGNYGNRPPRVVQQLPRGYRNYNWNGRPYYSYGGSWYRPYGGSYISIGVPYGLFVSTLPGYSSSFYYGNSRYYYYDDTYYMYEPARRGYVVTRSPYNDDPVESPDEQTLDDDLFIYPARGQSEQQQSDDRYECHRWAADETHYDPVDDAYQADERADYLRAMTACLTGRGYSVK